MAVKGLLGDRAECVACGVEWVQGRVKGRPKRYCGPGCERKARAARLAAKRAGEPREDETRNEWVTRASTGDFLDAVGGEGYRVSPRPNPGLSDVRQGRTPWGWPEWLVKGQEPAPWATDYPAADKWSPGPDEGATFPGVGPAVGYMDRPWWWDQDGCAIARALGLTGGAGVCEDKRQAASV